MAQTTALSNNIIGANLLAGATSWGTYEHCGQDLLIVVARENAFPFHESALGFKVDDTNDLSFIAGVYKNTLANWEEAQGAYPKDDYAIYHGCLRGEEICFYLS